MVYIFIILIALSLGGIVFLGFRKLSLKELSSKVWAVFMRKKQRKNQVDLASFVKNEDYWIELISSDPMNVQHYKKLGEWYVYNNKVVYAIKTLEYASKLDPKDKKILKHLENLKRQEV